MFVDSRVYTARALGARSRCMHAFVAAALWLVVCAAWSAELQVVSLSQSTPGTVIATVRAKDAEPPASAFHLTFQSAAAGARDFVAKEVTPSNASADLATTVIVCVDLSGSMHRVVPSMKSALQQVFAEPRPDLHAQLLTFGSSVSRQLMVLSSSQQDMSRALGAMRGEAGPDGKTRLYDAIVEAINRLRNDPAVQGGRLLVISDGKDEGSSISLDNLARIARQRGYAIDSIGYGALAPRSSSALETLSNATGGHYMLATTDAALAGAMRDDLGTEPLPAFDVRFEYPASNNVAAPGSAMLRYAAAGANTVVLPIAVPVAEPSADRPATVSASPSEQAPARAPARHQRTWLDALGTSLARIVERIGVALSALIASAFSLLLSGIGWWIYVTVKPHRVAQLYDAGQAPLNSPMPRRAHAPTQIGARFAPPARHRPTALLLGRSGNWRGQHYSIERATVRIGSDEKSDLVLTGDDFVSHRHAIMHYESGALYVTDLSSTNGTYVNGARLSGTTRALTPGDEIRFGRTTFELRGGEEDISVAHRGGDWRSVP